MIRSSLHLSPLNIQEILEESTYPNNERRDVLTENKEMGTKVSIIIIRRITRRNRIRSVVSRSTRVEEQYNSM